MPDTAYKQANFTLPKNVIDELRRKVPRGKQSQLVAEAIKKELKQMEFRKALQASFGAWSRRVHPELRGGVYRYLRRSRKAVRPL
ncbi:MAG: hypothetical protein QME74_06385 [Candidatus Edwardsbacteria bacterium]|nr:hypothetical protein [Candidatus Edwardsbacteria bacterium]